MLVMPGSRFCPAIKKTSGFPTWYWWAIQDIAVGGLGFIRNPWPWGQFRQRMFNFSIASDILIWYCYFFDDFV